MLLIVCGCVSIAVGVCSEVFVRLWRHWFCSVRRLSSAVSVADASFLQLVDLYVLFESIAFFFKSLLVELVNFFFFF